MRAQRPAAVLPGTGILKGPKCCEWQQVKKNALLLATNLGTKKTSYLLLHAKYLQGNGAPWKKLHCVRRCRLNGPAAAGDWWDAPRRVSTNSTPVAC